MASWNAIGSASQVWNKSRGLFLLALMVMVPASSLTVGADEAADGPEDDVLNLLNPSPTFIPDPEPMGFALIDVSDPPLALCPITFADFQAMPGPPARFNLHVSGYPDPSDVKTVKLYGDGSYLMSVDGWTVPEIGGVTQSGTLAVSFEDVPSNSADSYQLKFYDASGIKIGQTCAFPMYSAPPVWDQVGDQADYATPDSSGCPKKTSLVKSISNSTQEAGTGYHDTWKNLTSHSFRVSFHMGRPGCSDYPDDGNATFAVGYGGATWHKNPGAYNLGYGMIYQGSENKRQDWGAYYWGTFVWAKNGQAFYNKPVGVTASYQAGLEKGYAS